MRLQQRPDRDADTRRAETGSASWLAVLLISAAVVGCGAPEGRSVIENPVRYSVPLPVNLGPVYGYDYAYLTGLEPVAMRLEEELRIGAADDPERLFGGQNIPPQVAVGSDGRIFVLDPGNARVQVFTADGEFLTVIGQRGQGPGEFEQPNSIVAVDDRLFVLEQAGNRAVSVFTTAGAYVEMLRLPDPPARLLPAGPGGFLSVRICPEPHALCVRSYDVQAREGRDVVAISEPRGDESDIFATIVDRFLTGQSADVTPAHDGALYAMGSSRYEIARVDLDSGVVWNVRVDWPQIAVPDSDAAYIDWWAEQLAGLVPAADDWRPQTLDALAMVRIDEEGKLYVFPSDALRRDPEYDPWRPRPVHVYNADAELIRVGTIALTPTAWQVARDGKIYGARIDESTNEWVVVRSRLVGRP